MIMEDINPERRLADNIMKIHGDILLDKTGGMTTSGIALSQAYISIFSSISSPKSVEVCADALAHWVGATGYNNDGIFTYNLSQHIL